MVERTRRRSLLATGSLLSAIAGCLGSDSGEETQSTTTQVATNSPTPDATEPGASSARTDSLYVDNRDSTEYTIGVRVRDAGAEPNETLVSGTYRVPAETKVDYGEIGTPGSEYAVTIRFESGEWETHTWSVSTCENSEHAPSGGDTNALIIIEGGEYRFVVSACDVHGFHDSAVSAADIEIGRNETG